MYTLNSPDGLVYCIPCVLCARLDGSTVAAKECRRMLLEVKRKGDDMLVTRDTLSDRAADRLRDLILLEELRPGQVLAERELAERLGISRTPLREALRILASEGLVEMEANRRPRVYDPSMEQLLALVDVLAALERLAGRVAADRISEVELIGLYQLVANLEGFPLGGDELEFFNMDMAIHAAVVAATGNQPLQKTHAQYNAALFRARFMSTRWRARRPLMNEQHRKIVDLLRDRNGEAAGETMHAHLMQLKINIADLMAERSAAKAHAPVALT
jgi:DNA-binding GntR family transcriptional regulator